MNHYKNRVIIVSGGSRGLGEGLVTSLLEHGHTVATFSRSSSDFIEEMALHQEARFFWQSLDVNDMQALKAFVMEVQKRFGRIDGLVNNAGVTLDALLPITTDQQITDTIAINLQSAIALSRNVARVMMRQQSGSIVNISSILGSRGHKGVSVYGATKAALDGFSRGLARELGSKHIRVNAVSPGFIATDMTHNMPDDRKRQIVRRTPLGRLGRVNDIIPAIEFLLDDGSRFMTGQTITIDGGLTC